MFLVPTTGIGIGDIMKARQLPFKAKMSLQGQCPLNQIKLVRGGPELATVFNNHRLVRDLFPSIFFAAGLEAFVPMVQNIPALLEEYRHYAIGVV